MLLTTTNLETSPYASMLQWAPAVGSEPPTRHGPKPRLSQWEQMCLKVNDVTRLKRREFSSRRTPGFARLAYEVDKVEHHETDGTEADELSEFDPGFVTSKVDQVGIDTLDEAGRWLAKREEKDSKRAAA